MVGFRAWCDGQQALTDSRQDLHCSVSRWFANRMPTAHPVLHCSWEAALLVLDSRPFEDLHHIVEDFQDDRIWVFAEWVRVQHGATSSCTLRRALPAMRCVGSRAIACAGSRATACASPLFPRPCAG